MSLWWFVPITLMAGWLAGVVSTLWTLWWSGWFDQPGKLGDRSRGGR